MEIGSRVEWKAIKGMQSGTVVGVEEGMLRIQPDYCAGGYSGTHLYEESWVALSYAPRGTYA